MTARLNYVELPATDIAKTKRFYEAAFGWTLTEFAPTYAATTTDDVDIGLQADRAERRRRRSRSCTSRIGGGAQGGDDRRRRDNQADLRLPRRPPLSLPRPSGNELAVWQTA